MDPSSVGVPSDGRCFLGTWLQTMALLPLPILFMVFAVMRLHAASTARTAVSVNIFMVFIQHLAYSVVIPSSYDIAVRAGSGATSSGMLVSLQQMGALIGNLFMWSMLQHSPGLWKAGRGSWWVMFVAATFNLVGAMGYCWSMYAGTSSEAAPAWLAPTLIAWRVLDGIGLGMNVQFFPMQILHCIASPERGQWMANSQLAVMLGTGCGPLVAAVASSLSSCRGTESEFAAAGAAYAGMGIACFVTAAAFYPTSFEDVVDEHSSPSRAAKSVEGSMDVRVPMAILFLVMTSLRGFVISSLEVATSLILEVSYSWTTTEIGYAIGACFLCSGPVKLLHNLLSERLSTENWVRAFTLAATLAALLLFRKSCSLFGLGDDCAATLFAADALLFPTLFLADALTAGMVLQQDRTLAAESWLAPNMLMLYRGLVVAGGRVLAGPLTRMVVAKGSRDAYAVQQVASTVVWLAFYEAFNLLASPRRLSILGGADRRLAAAFEADSESRGSNYQSCSCSKDAA